MPLTFTLTSRHEDVECKMKIRKFTFWVWIIAVLMSGGCVQRVNPQFKPSDDPLVCKIFERHLKAENIDFTLTSNGYYEVSERVSDRVAELSEKSNFEANGSIAIQVSDDCAKGYLIAALKKRDVVYVEEQIEGNQFLRTTPTFISSREVLSLYSKGELQCGALNSSKGTLE